MADRTNPQMFSYFQGGASALNASSEESSDNSSSSTFRPIDSAGAGTSHNLILPSPLIPPSRLHQIPSPFSPSRDTHQNALFGGAVALSPLLMDPSPLSSANDSMRSISPTHVASPLSPSLMGTRLAEPTSGAEKPKRPLSPTV